MQASMGLAQLDKLEEMHDKRKRILIELYNTFKKI
jgi:dTDP-4-amino-4,6-dideoxygalactose transaminase